MVLAGLRPEVIPEDKYLNQRFEDQANPEHLAYADQMADKYGVPRTLYRSLVAQESNWRFGPDSEAGAQGYSQLMPETAAELGVDPKDWRENLEGGAKYLSQMKKQFGTWDMALVAYNAGPGNAARRGRDLSKYKPETINYLKQIRSRNGGSLPPD